MAQQDLQSFRSSGLRWRTFVAFTLAMASPARLHVLYPVGGFFWHTVLVTFRGKREEEGRFWKSAAVCCTHTSTVREGSNVFFVVFVLELKNFYLCMIRYSLKIERKLQIPMTSAVTSFPAYVINWAITNCKNTKTRHQKINIFQLLQ